MRSKAIIIIALLALVSLMIMPVSAETLTGTLGGIGTNQTLFSIGSVTTGSPPTLIVANDIENSGEMYSMVYWPGAILNTDVGAPVGIGVPFTAYLLTTYNGVHVDENPVGSGTIGYQKIYNTATPPVEQTTGYLWLVFDSWNSSGRSGDVYLDINMTSPYALYNYTIPNMGAGFSSIPSGSIGLGRIVGNNGATGSYSNIKLITAQGTYSATKPSGLNIAGYVNKTGNSRIFIQNASDYTVASDNLANDNDFVFSVYPDQIYIKMLSPSGTWYNSSLLFAAPTPTTTIPAGYVRTWFISTDGMTGGSIYNSEINLLDVENSSWRNTSDAEYGLSYIDTLPYHTINAYGSADEYTSISRLGLDAKEGIYELIMWSGLLSAGEGNINLLVTVGALPSGLAVAQASVQATVVSTGATTGGITSLAGTELFVVPNATAIKVTAWKSGYIMASKTITTSDFGPDSVRIDLQTEVITVTPTATPFPGEATPRPTLDQRTTTEKDQDMMEQIRDAGPMLISLAIIATLFGLVKLIAKK